MFQINDWSQELENLFSRHLERIGVDYDSLGPVDSILCRVKNGIVRFYDSNASFYMRIDDGLHMLKMLPKGADRQEFWNATNEFQDLGSFNNCVRSNTGNKGA